MKDCRIYKVYSIVLYSILLCIVVISFIVHKRILDNSRGEAISNTIHPINIEVVDFKLLDKVNDIQNSLDSLKMDLQELKEIKGKKDSVVVKLNLMQY